MVRRGLLTIAVLAGITACGGDEDGGDTTADVADTGLTAMAELLLPLKNVSVAEVEYGEAAASKAARADIRAYAQTVASDHQMLGDSLDAFTAAHSLPVAAETTAAAELVNAVRAAHSGLENLTNAEFDLAYIRAEVESHRMLLARLDQELIPAAGDAATRTLLTNVRAMVDAHLTRARQLLASLLDRPASPPPSPPPPRDTTTPPPPVTTGG